VQFENYSCNGGYGAIVTYGILNPGYGQPIDNTFKAGLYYAWGTKSWSDPCGCSDPTEGGFTLVTNATARFADENIFNLPGFFNGGTVQIPGYTNGPITFVVIAYDGLFYSCSNRRGHSAPFTLSSITTGGIPTYFDGLQSFQAMRPLGPLWPWIYNHPQSQSVNAGSNATFSATVNGVLPLSYQWRHNGATVQWTTNNSSTSTYSINAVSSADAGNYDVVVFDACTLYYSTSFVATLTVTVPNLTAKTTNQGVALHLSGTPNYPYILQATTNLMPPVLWQQVTTNLADTNGHWSFTDTNALTTPARFFRITVQ
jgi:hypothetical protein